MSENRGGIFLTYAVDVTIYSQFAPKTSYPICKSTRPR